MKCCVEVLLLSFWISIHHILAQTSPDFISLDCGLGESDGYDDPVIGLPYISDEGLIKTGKSRSISPEFKTPYIPRQFWNMRSFPDGSRNCYTLIPSSGKGSKVLLRAGFMYGNYDDQSKSPKFDLHLGVDYWDTITFEGSSTFYYVEIIHVLKSDYLHVCVVNTGHGTPFISVLELRPMNIMYNTTSGSLYLLVRWDFGSTRRPDDVLRYKDGDAYDRIWTPFNLLNTTKLSNPATGSSFTQNPFEVPSQVMATANEATTTNDTLYFYKTSPEGVYDYLHFAELRTPSSSSFREMNIYMNGKRYNNETIVPTYLSTLSLYSPMATVASTYSWKINATSKSSLPPMLNAAEFFIVKQFTHYEANDTHVTAIISIREIYAITRNWQGDPCWPKEFAWTGVECSYNGFQPPNLISLNLSSSGLVGTIAPSISNLTMLQSLDLSYNNLTGQLPDFLSRLPSLKYLYLQGNGFNTTLPPALLEKSRNGSLILRFENINPPANRSKKKNTIIVPITASFAAFIAILILVALSFTYIRRKRHTVQSEEPVKSNTNINGGDPIIEPKLRQCTFAEVMNMIRDKKVVGEGGFGVVYRSIMDGVEVAVKILKVSLEQETGDLHSEVKILAKVHHRNLIKILGYCNEGKNRAIIFELLENGNLKNYLSESSPKVLSWELRLYIMIDAAQGLEYLHHGCTPPIIHRDIKPENILLTKDYEAKLADFGLSRIFPAHTTREVGTPGYYDNEYMSEVGVLTEKMDVYSFGVVLLVAVTGQPAIAEGKHITQRIAPKIVNGDIKGIVDPRLRGNYDINVAWKMVELGMACVARSRTTSSRPNMHDVVRELNECLPIHDGPSQLITTLSRPRTR